jgi:prolipoprotein diacylglyceryl transferase
MLAIQWNVNPELFNIGPFHIRYYGLMFILAFATGAFIFAFILKREKLPLSILIRLLNIVFLSTFIGARIGDCFFYYPEYYLQHQLQIFFPFSDGKFTGFTGLSSHGAAIGLLAGLYLFSRSAKLSYLWLLDRIVIVIALGGFFIRIGNLMNSEICGLPTNLPWGFVFLRNNEYIARHPAQLYEAFAYLSIFIFLGYCYVKKHAKLVQGLLLGMFLILTFTARFLIEYLKAPQIIGDETLFLSIGQKLSLPFIFAGAFILMGIIMRIDIKHNKYG